MGSPFTAATTVTERSGITMRAASEGSVNYLRDLMVEKARTRTVDVNEAEQRINYWLEGRNQREVSENIDRLKAEGFTGHREVQGSTQSNPVNAVVPAGRYAIETGDGATNALAFYKVDRPTEGRWAGYVFVKLLVSDNEQRLSREASATVLRNIAAVGAQAASARYGHEIGECGVCGRTLTNDESRARGIGPICADKAGW